MGLGAQPSMRDGCREFLLVPLQDWVSRRVLRKMNLTLGLRPKVSGLTAPYSGAFGAEDCLVGGALISSCPLVTVPLASDLAPLSPGVGSHFKCWPEPAATECFKQ